MNSACANIAMACIRAFWILSGDGHVPLFSRRFPTVEHQWQAECCQSRHLVEEHGHVPREVLTAALSGGIPFERDVADAFAEHLKRLEDKSGAVSLGTASLAEIGTDDWLNDPVTRHIISLRVHQEPPPPAADSSPSNPQLPPDQSRSATSAPSHILWPLVHHRHSKANAHILVLPLVSPCHVAAYHSLTWHPDRAQAMKGCDLTGGFKERGGHVLESPASLSSILFEMPSVTTSLSLALALEPLLSADQSDAASSSSSSSVPSSSSSAEAGGGGGGGGGEVSSVGGGISFGILDTITAGIGIGPISKAATARPRSPLRNTNSSSGTASGGGSSGGSGWGRGGDGNGGLPVRRLKAGDKEAVRSFVANYLPLGSIVDLPSLASLSTLRNLSAPQESLAQQLLSKPHSHSHHASALPHTPPVAGSQKDKSADVAAALHPRQPAWKPVLHVGKQRILVSINETLSAAIYDLDEGADVADVAEVEGSVVCRCELEGLPDVEISFAVPDDVAMTSMAVHSCAQPPGENFSKLGSFVLCFCPPLGPFSLLNYANNPPPSSLPVKGFYQLHMVSPDEGQILVKLKIMEGYKPPFNMEFCSVKFPFPCRTISAVHLSPSMGTTASSEKSVEWRIFWRGYSGKPLEVSLSGSVNFLPLTAPSSGQGAWGEFEEFPGGDCVRLENEEYSGGVVGRKRDDALQDSGGRQGMAPASWDEPLTWDAFDLAQVQFRLLGGSISGLTVDPKKIAVFPSTARPAPVEITSQVLCGRYILWNSVGRSPHTTTPSRLVSILKEDGDMKLHV